MLAGRQLMPPDNGTRKDLDEDRAARALGRGLEDVSHLFLSAAGETSRKGHEDVPPEPSAAGAAPRPRVAVLRGGTALSKEQLIATLVECRDALEEGIRACEARVVCDPYGEIDILALDRFGRLCVVDVDTLVGDGLLLRGISHVEWATRNLATLRRLFQTTALDLSRPARLILVAPRYSRVLTSALRQLAGPPIVCFKYHAVASFGGTGVFFEPLDDQDD
jgi:hypothetical protein